MKKFALKIGSIFKSLLLLRLDLLTFNIVPLMIFEICYRVLTVFCVSPIIYSVFETCIKLSGQEYVNDSNLLIVITNPFTIIFAICLIVVLAYFCVIELGALIYVFEKSRRREKVSFYKLIRFSLLNGARIFKLKNLPMFFIILVLNPIFNIGVTSSFLSLKLVPNFILEQLSQNAFLLIIFTAILVVGVIFSFRWMYCLHFFTIEQVDARQAFKGSSSLTRKRRVLNFLSMQIIQIVIGIMNSLMVLLSGILINNVYNTIDYSSVFVEVGSFVLLVAFFTLYFILLCLFMPLSSLKVSSLYYNYKEASGQTLVDLNLDELSFDINRKKHKDYDNTCSNNKRKPYGINKTVSIIIITALVFVGAYFGVSYIIDEISDTSIDVAETKIITKESDFVLKDFKTTINSAKENGADAYMLNVYISGDGEAYCMENAMYFSLFEALNFDYKNANLSQIVDFLKNSKESAGSFTESKIMPLREFLDYAKNVDIDLVLEVSNADWYDGSQKIIINDIQNHYQKDTFAICSKNIDSLSVVKSINRDFVTIFSQIVAIGNFDCFKQTVDYIMLDSVSLSRSQVSSLHESGFGVIAWTSSNKSNIKTAQNYGVDAVYVTNARDAVKFINDSNDMELARTAFKRYAFISLFRDLIW